MPSHARTVTRTTHRVRNALLVVLLLLVVCAAAAGFSGFKLYKSAMSAKAHLNNVVNAAKVIKDGSTDDMVKALSDVSYIQKEAAAAKQDVSGGLWTLAEKMPVVGGDVKTARTAIGTIDDFAQTTLPQLGKVVTTLTGASLSSGDGQLNMEPIIAAAQQLATVDQSVQSQARTIQDLPDAKLGVVNNALQNGKTQMAAELPRCERRPQLRAACPDEFRDPRNRRPDRFGRFLQRGQRQDRGGGVPRGCRVPLQRRVG